MDYHPEPYEDFELMYEDELELLNDHEYSSIDTSVAKTAASSQASSAASKPPTQKKQLPELTPDLFITQKSQDVTPIETQSEHLHLSQYTDTEEANRKRKAHEVFGDIDDLDDFFFDEAVTKKSKANKEEEQLELIEHILRLRKLAKEKQNITTYRTSSTLSNIERDKANLSYRVPKYPFIGVTRLDNERLYVRFHSEEYELEEMERLSKDLSFQGLMGDSFKNVWEDANLLINNKIDAASTKADDDINNAMEVIDDAHQQKDLWVELYKPRRYLELLSDESTNRIMLKWMKLWDKVVFNRNPRVKPIKKDEATGFKKFTQLFELNTNLDEHGRPFHKVALLCGPPGLGKTTLAHMVAKHAGYNVVEVNASDDRSLEAFKTSLENATQMRSVVDQERRPNCLVFDEIDGAPQTSIDFLVKFVQGTTTNRATKKGGAKPQKQSILKRPIICICNDVYVPALRPLRQIAFVVNCPPVTTARLAERLMEIARRQHIKTDMGAMMALAEKSNNDIRSCLSVLHFFKAQNKPISLSDVYKASIGQKDVQKGIFSVWNAIFQIDRRGSDKGNNLSQRMQKVLQSVSAFGDFDRVAQGVFENYQQIKLKDSTIGTTAECLSWFVFADLLNQQIHQQQIYTLTTYLQYSFVVWHFAFATMAKQKINFPNVGYEKKQKELRQKSLINEMLKGMQPSVWINCSRLSLILDILPFLLTRIIVPNFRPVSLHLYTPTEKENMLKVVHIMIDYNLNYIQERLPDGTYAYNLEPNVEDLVVFEKSTNRKTLSYSNRQLVAREIELEKMRKFETPKTLETKQKKKKNGESSKDIEVKQQLPNHLQKLKSKSPKEVKPAIRKDFFGRIIENVQSSDQEEYSRSNDIWYKYKEGHNNAVKKRITVSYLL